MGAKRRAQCQDKAQGDRCQAAAAERVGPRNYNMEHATLCVMDVLTRGSLGHVACLALANSAQVWKKNCDVIQSHEL